MKFYYLTVGLAGLATTFYLGFTYTVIPGWIAAILGYTCSTPVVVAIFMHIGERRNVKHGRS